MASQAFCGLQVNVRCWLAPFHVLAANQKLKSFKNIDLTQRRDRKRSWAARDDDRRAIALLDFIEQDLNPGHQPQFVGKDPNKSGFDFLSEAGPVLSQIVPFFQNLQSGLRAPPHHGEFGLSREGLAPSCEEVVDDHVVEMFGVQ